MKPVFLVAIFTVFCLCLPSGADTQKAEGNVQLDPPLVQALKLADVDKARTTLAKGADVEEKSFWVLYGDLVTQELMTPEQGVFYAFFGAENKQLELIKLLLEYKAKPDPHLVWYAASAGRVALVEQFLTYKADPNAKSRWGTTPLAGAKNSYDYVLEQIEKVGAEEAGKPRKNLMNGLMEAPLIVQKRNLERIIEMLKLAGANDTSK